MSRLGSLDRVAAAVVAGNLLFSVPASARTQTYLDLSASGGYSTNPIFTAADNADAAFVRLSGYGSHSIVSEKGATSLSVFGENATYTNNVGSTQILSLNADTRQAINERTTLFGSLGASADIGGQLSNRFISVPTEPVIPNPTAPPPVTVVDPDLFAFSSRTYRLTGQVGASIQTSEVSTVTVSGGASRTWLNGSFLNDHTNMFATGSYDRVLSERTAVGFQLSASRTVFDDDAGDTVVLTPQATVRTQLSEAWDASAAVGVSFSRVESAGVNDDWSASLALSGNLCRNAENERLCASLSRGTQNSALADLATSTSLGLSYFKRLDEAQTVQLSAGVTRYSTDDLIAGKIHSNYYRIAANYDRKIKDRLFAGATASARKLSQNGPDPDTDLNISAYIRYRLGDIQ